MAVKEVGPETANDGKEYLGLSTDTKPTKDVPPNSYFYEADTKCEYIFDGSNWYLL